jgi:hypothetical protein
VNPVLFAILIVGRDSVLDAGLSAAGEDAVVVPGELAQADNKRTNISPIHDIPPRILF